jgi:hypothetical protein
MSPPKSGGKILALGLVLSAAVLVLVIVLGSRSTKRVQPHGAVCHRSKGNSNYLGASLRIWESPPRIATMNPWC